MLFRKQPIHGFGRISRNRNLIQYTRPRPANSAGLVGAPADPGALLLLLHLKAYQKQGFFSSSVDLPGDLRRHIAKCLGLDKQPTKAQRQQYDRSATRKRHIPWIRTYVGSRTLDEAAHAWLSSQATKAAESREVLADIINILLEELVRHRFEIPGFTVLLRLAKDARATVNDRCYRSIVSELNDETKALVNDLLVSPPGIEISGWQRLKREIRKPTNKEIGPICNTSSG